MPLIKRPADSLRSVKESTFRKGMLALPLADRPPNPTQPTGYLTYYTPEH